MKHSIITLVLFASAFAQAQGFDPKTVGAINGKTTTPAPPVSLEQKFAGNPNAIATIKTSQAESISQEKKDEVNDFLTASGLLGTAEPLEQDPDNPFYVRANHTQRPWNQLITLSAYGGGDGTITFLKSSGDCTVYADGRVVLGAPIPQGQRNSECVVYATNTITPQEYWKAEEVTLTFTGLCLDDGIPLTADAPSQANVGDSVQINASGGGCVGYVNDDLTDEGYIQYLKTGQFCDVTEDGVVTATQVGTCRVRVHKSVAGAINEVASQYVNIDFTDPDSNAPLSLIVPNTRFDNNETAQVTVLGGGPGNTGFDIQGGCRISASGVIDPIYPNVTCVAIGAKNDQTATSQCVDFGRGSAVPPALCRDADYNDGAFVLNNPWGGADINSTHQIGYQGGNGADLGLVTISMAQPNSACSVSTVLNTVTADSETVCVVRAFSGALGGYAKNYLCVPFGDAPLSEECVIENAGGPAPSDFDFTHSTGLTGNAVGTQITLTGTNLGMGGSADWYKVNPDNFDCVFNGGNPYKLGQREVTLIHSASDGACGVKAWRQGYPDNVVTKCFAFGDWQVTNQETCAGEPSEAPTLTFVADANTTSAGSNLRFTATLSRNLRAGESIQIDRVVDNGVDALVGNCFFGGNLDYPYISGEARSEHTRVMYCQYNGTYRMRAVFNWAGETIEQTICVRYGDGSPNANCPVLSSEPEQEAPANNDDESMSLTLSTNSAAQSESVTLTAANAGAEPTWRVRNRFNSGCLWTPTSDASEITLSVSNQDAICEVTLEHDDDPDNEITRCVRFGNISDGTFTFVCPDEPL